MAIGHQQEPCWIHIITNDCLNSWIFSIRLRSTHYSDFIMGAMASQITSLTIVYSTVYSRRRSKKTSKHRVTGLRAGNSPVTGEFPAQMASNAENVSIWWRHLVCEKSRNFKWSYPDIPLISSRKSSPYICQYGLDMMLVTRSKLSSELG